MYLTHQQLNSFTLFSFAFRAFTFRGSRFFDTPARAMPIAVSARSTVERLPWECYLLRGALSVESQRAVVECVNGLAVGAFPTWPSVAKSQDHPIIVASHSANAKRSRECRRACGLDRCAGYCGAHVGALVERPGKIYRLANDIAAKIAKDLGRIECGFPLEFDKEKTDDGPTKQTPFEATHFWGLVYGARGGGSGDAEHVETEDTKTTEETTTSEKPKDVFSFLNNVTFGGVAMTGKQCDTDTNETKAVRENINSGKMSSHLDRPVGWTLSVSVGRSVIFNLGRPPDKNKKEMYGDYAHEKAAPGQTAPGVTLTVNSGDALLFRGHAVFHAVDGFAERSDTEAKKCALEGLSSSPRKNENSWRPQRLALLFRHEVDAESG